MEETNTENNNETNKTSETKSNGMNWMLIVVALVVLLAGGYYYMTKSSQEEMMDKTVTTEQSATDTANEEGSMGEETTEDQNNTQEDVLMNDQGNAPEGTSTTPGSSEEEKTISVEGGMFYFKPNKITVKKGVPVTVTLNSVGGLHDFVIDELIVKSEKINNGESTSITFTPDKVGEYEFYCSVSNHKAMGMVGTLVVE